ncbi:MAG: rhomboid family intramembrane serine protease [Chloroflexi bacterium]|nr:MAG: rhomboid family intramembrane serine protease [Chloroflexota bacterium]
MIPIKDYPGPRRRLPWVTWGIIAVNIVVFLYQVSLGPDAPAFMFAYSVVPVALTHGVPQTSLPGVPAHLPFHTPNPVYLTIITAMFLHAGWLHIGGNMLFLYIFGDNVEDRMGHLPYLVFYLFCGVIASITQVAIDPGSPVPSLGASGAIAGVLAAYLVLFPWARVRTIIFIFIFFTIVTLPAIILIGLWFLLQFFDGVASLSTVQQGMGGVAYFAHVGGFIAGLVITLLFRPLLRPPAPTSYPYLPRHSGAVNAREWWQRP